MRPEQVQISSGAEDRFQLSDLPFQTTVHACYRIPRAQRLPLQGQNVLASVRII